MNTNNNDEMSQYDGSTTEFDTEHAVSEELSNSSTSDEALSDPMIDEQGQHDSSGFEDTTGFEDTMVSDLPVEHVAPVPIPLNRGQWLQIYLIGVIFSNLYLLFLDGHFDIGFWKNWVTQLAATGFTNYQGDYPPLWSNWLYVVSRFYLAVHLPVENTILFKYVTQIPITAYHLILTCIVYKILQTHAKTESHFHAAMLLTAFNPAILFNGPIWGQIDVAPLIPLIAAILAGVSKRYQVFTVPLYALSLLTKFQMIGFAPVFGILFFRNIRLHLIGILLSIPTFIIAFLPSIVAHNFVQAFTLPYISAMHMFSAATMGASNLWILLVGNLAPDNTLLFGVTPNSKLASVLNVRSFGMIVFSIVCLFVFLAGMKKLAAKKFEQNQDVLASDIFFYALVCGATFFTILPGMHERYLLPTAIVALAYFASSPSKAFYAIALTFISAFNLTMSHGIKTTSIWPSLSWIMLAVFGYLILEFVLGDKWLRLVRFSVSKITSIKWLALWIFLISVYTTTNILYQKTRINTVDLLENQMLLTQLNPNYTSQDYGTLQINLNVTGNPLSVGGKRYANGFGTHANSIINFTLPENTEKLSFIVGLDDEVDAADVKFSVWGDERLLWESQTIYKSEKNYSPITVDLTGVKQLSLRVSGLDGISGDHANWINPVITIKRQQ